MDPHNQSYGIRAPAPPNHDQTPPVPSATSSYHYFPSDPPSIPNPPQHQELSYPQQNQSQVFAPPPPPPPPPPDESTACVPESTAYSGGFAQPPQGLVPAGQAYWNEHGQWIGGYYGSQEPPQQQQQQHEQQQCQGLEQIAAQSQYYQDPHQQYQEYYQYQQYDAQYAGHQGNQYDLTQSQAPQQYYPPQAPGADSTTVQSTPQTQMTEQAPSGQEDAVPPITQIPVDLSQMIIPQAMAQHYIVPQPHAPQSDLSGGGLGMIPSLVPSKPKSAVPEWLKQEMMKRGIKQPNSEEEAATKDEEKRGENATMEARRFTEEKARSSDVGGKSDATNGDLGKSMEESVEINKAVKSIALPLLLEVTEAMYVEIAKEAMVKSREGQASRVAMPIIMEVADTLLADIAVEVHRMAVAERSVLLASKETSNTSGGGKSSSEGPLGMDLLGLGYASDSSNSNAESPEVKGTLDSSQMEVEEALDNDVDQMSGDEKGIPEGKEGSVGDADAPGSTGRGPDVTLSEGKRRSGNQGSGVDASTRCDVKERAAGSGAHIHRTAGPAVRSRATGIEDLPPASTGCKDGDSEKPAGKLGQSSRGRKDGQKKTSRGNDRERSRSPKKLEDSKRGGSRRDKKKESRSRSPSKKQRKRSLQRRSRSRSRDARKRHNHHGDTSKARLRNISSRRKATSPSINSITSSASEERGRRELKQRDSQRSRSSRRKKSIKERKSRH